MVCKGEMNLGVIRGKGSHEENMLLITIEIWPMHIKSQFSESYNQLYKQSISTPVFNIV